MSLCCKLAAILDAQLQLHAFVVAGWVLVVLGADGAGCWRWVRLFVVGASARAALRSEPTQHPAPSATRAPGAGCGSCCCALQPVHRPHVGTSRALVLVAGIPLRVLQLAATAPAIGGPAALESFAIDAATEASRTERGVAALVDVEAARRAAPPRNPGRAVRVHQLCG